jgi:hypothetical protein
LRLVREPPTVQAPGLVDGPPGQASAPGGWKPSETAVHSDILDVDS